MSGVFYEAGKRLSEEHAKAAAVLIPQQMDLELFRNNCNHRDPRWVDVFAYGLFPAEDPDKQVILQGWFARHEAAWTPAAPPAVEAFGLDIAYSSDGDQTCLAAGGKDGLAKLHLWHEPDAMKTIAKVLALSREHHSIELQKGQIPVCVDCDGAGYIVANRLRELGVFIIEFHGSSRAEVAPDVYGNLRAEGYSLLGRRLSPLDLWQESTWRLAPDDLLREELCAPEKMYQGNDALRYFITPKNRNPDKENVVCIRDKLHRSPDRGDSVVYLWHAVRYLHNFNDWLRRANRDLVMYPRLDDKFPTLPQAMNTIDPAAPVATDPAITAALREDYGKLLDKPEKQEPPDWFQHYKRDAAERDEQDRKAREAAEGKPIPPPAWHERIWQDRD